MRSESSRLCLSFPGEALVTEATLGSPEETVVMCLIRSEQGRESCSLTATGIVKVLMSSKTCPIVAHQGLLDKSSYGLGVPGWGRYGLRGKGRNL